MSNTAILLIDSPDQKGLVAGIAEFLYRHNANIVHADQHQDATHGLFFMRVEWALEAFDLDRDRFVDEFRPIAERTSRVLNAYAQETGYSVGISVTSVLATNLFERGAVSRQRLDAAETARRAASAQRNLAQATLAQAEAALRRAREVQRDATLTSPIDGVVVERNYDAGSLVGPGDKPVVVVADLRVMKLEAGVSELEAGRDELHASVRHPNRRVAALTQLPAARASTPSAPRTSACSSARRSTATATWTWITPP